MTDSIKGQVRIYACGGGGLNIGQRLEKHRGVTEAGFAVPQIAYIDTSRSNLNAAISPDNVYLLEGMDGSGKVRSENYEEITNHIHQMMQQFKPGDLSIVLHTLAGGSGSVIGPLLISELLEQDKPAVVIAVGSTSTRLDAENTLKTLKSYEAIAKKRGAPVTMFYVENGETTPRKDVDIRASEFILSLCLLYSREHRELDTRDLRNFLRYSEKVSSFPAQLVAVTAVEKTNDLSRADLGNIISVATLAAEGSSTDVVPPPEYQCTGFVPAAVDREITARMPMHFLTCDGIIPKAAQRLHTLIREIDDSKQAVLARMGGKSLVSAADKADDKGMVL